MAAENTCGGCQGLGAHSRACLSPLLALAERVESIGDLLSPVLANRAWRVAEEMRALAAPAPTPVPLTREQEIAFRKDWDARVVPSAQASGERGPGNSQSIIGTRDRAES